MVKFIEFLILAGCVLVLFLGPWIGSLFQIRKRNQNKLKSKPTMFDVRNFIIKGDKEAAIKYYCQIFSVDRQNAQTAVNELERSIQEKNFEV